MKKAFCLISTLVLLLCGCTQPPENPYFTETEDGVLVSPDGVEYTRLADEGALYYLGEPVLVAPVEGEEETATHITHTSPTGMFSIPNNDNVLVRQEPHSEWFSLYRKADLPEFDFSTANCVRLEYVTGFRLSSADGVHASCQGGISDKTVISDFFAAVRSQKDPHSAGLYDLVRTPDGLLENCYFCGTIYGFFEEEPNLVIKMDITSYNDLAHSIWLGQREYVLPEAWLQQFLGLQCTNE